MVKGKNRSKQAKWLSDKATLEKNISKIKRNLDGTLIKIDEESAKILRVNLENADKFIELENKKINKVSEELTEEKVRMMLGECYEDIILFLKNYIDMREENYPLIALWIIGTYFHKSFNSFPYLFVNAMRGSGKTRLLGIIKELSWNGELLTSVRESSLFRSAGNSTICIDEFEGIMKKENAGLREILNASYKKGMTIKRMRKARGIGGEEFVVEEFEPYTPIVMANIWGVEEVLGDRCISIILEKSNNKNLIRKLEDFQNNEKIIKIKKKLHKCSLCSYLKKNINTSINKEWNEYIDNISIYNTYTTLTTLTTQTTHNYEQIVPKNSKKLSVVSVVFFNKIYETGIVGRDLELFMPLFVIANAITTLTTRVILETALKLHKEKKVEERTESRDVMLFNFIAMQDENGDFVDLIDLLNMFKNYVHDDEKDFQWLNSRWLGRALKRLSLIIEKRRIGSGMQVILDVKKAKLKAELFK